MGFILPAIVRQWLMTAPHTLYPDGWATLGIVGIGVSALAAFYLMLACNSCQGLKPLSLLFRRVIDLARALESLGTFPKLDDVHCSRRQALIGPHDNNAVITKHEDNAQLVFEVLQQRPERDPPANSPRPTLINLSR